MRGDGKRKGRGGGKKKRRAGRPVTHNVSSTKGRRERVVLCVRAAGRPSGHRQQVTCFIQGRIRTLLAINTVLCFIGLIPTVFPAPNINYRMALLFMFTLLGQAALGKFDLKTSSQFWELFLTL